MIEFGLSSNLGVHFSFFSDLKGCLLGIAQSFFNFTERLCVFMHIFSIFKECFGHKTCLPGTFIDFKPCFIPQISRIIRI